MDFRHGDIFFKRVEKVEAKERQEKPEHIVAYGEATGHHHLMTAAPGTLVAIMKGFDERTYVEVTGVATLTHQEHNTLSIEPGTYEIVTEQEWDYFENDRKKVVD